MIGGVVLAVLLYVCVERFTMAHKYLLADNRHYTFYLWRKVFMRADWVKFALIPG
jgi:alpha-1,2-glucosyltransferase